MNISLGEVLALFFFTACFIYLFGALRVREVALRAVRASCKRDGAQLLDEAVSLRRLSFSRDATGRWRVWRQYRFEYSFHGTERRRGSVTMLGQQLQSVIIEDPVSGGSTIH